jgi:hypothetical protein
MSLQLHRPDGEGGLEVRKDRDRDWQTELRSPRWGASLKGGRLPALRNPEMQPTTAVRSLAFWMVLGLITFVVLLLGYWTGFWALPPRAG